MKSISFSNFSDPYLNTLFAKNNPNQLASYLKYSYEASVNLFGNDLFYNKVNYFAIPAAQFNVGTTGLSISYNKDVFGLSGYYQVSRYTDEIRLGDYTTTITARNMYSPNLENLKAQKCKKKPSITGSATGTQQEEEKPDFVDHQISSYILESIRDVPEMSTIFNLIYDDKKPSEVPAVG